MRCHQCGAELSKRHVSCPYCGEAVPVKTNGVTRGRSGVGPGAHSRGQSRRYPSFRERKALFYLLSSMGAGALFFLALHQSGKIGEAGEDQPPEKVKLLVLSPQQKKRLEEEAWARYQARWLGLPLPSMKKRKMKKKKE